MTNQQYKKIHRQNILRNDREKFKINDNPLTKKMIA